MSSTQDILNRIVSEAPSVSMRKTNPLDIAEKLPLHNLTVAAVCKPGDERALVLELRNVLLRHGAAYLIKATFEHGNQSVGMTLEGDGQ